ncbi:hypothetical protein BDP27DRAFT_1513884 [Rhodocollybia butyracea]|uniref:Uncharacterized protein n=1 Tax=Rhodocollybia butyracea TaxID=206335 RepID=A0A9P5P916_9AGAR|nr:hypothetical protein BDP27DRAFT_1513884 [Rhodocollybia butyracea]
MSASNIDLLSGTKAAVPGPFQSMIAHSLEAVEITSDYCKAAADVPNGKMELIPPYGTHGFVNKVYKMGSWVVNVYAYLHINSDKVTFVLLHSGSFGSTDNTESTNDEGYPRTGFSVSTGPESEDMFHNPMTYDSKLDDDRYSYHIDYAETINMLGPGGKNPIVFPPTYSDSFSGQLMGATPVPPQFPPQLAFFPKLSHARVSSPDQVVGVIPYHMEIGRSEFN